MQKKTHTLLNILIAGLAGLADKIHNKNPIIKNPKGERQAYLQTAQEAKEKQYPETDNYENRIGFSIQPDWFHELALHTQVVVKKSEINYQHGRLLYSTLRKYLAEHNPASVNIIETGTARGFSALCMAKALADADKPGTIMTFDVLPHNTKIYWNCIDDHEGKKTRAELLKNYTDLSERYIIFNQGDTKIQLPKFGFTRIHFAFLDGAHKYGHLMSEFKAFEHAQKAGDIIFFDDYDEKKYPGVVKAVDEICSNYNYSKKLIKSSESRVYVIAEKNKL